MILNEAFWDDKYKSHDTGWDIGKISNPLKNYIDQLTNKDLKILIPGGGNSYEAEYLFYKGFKNIFVVDISQTALNNIKKRIPKFPENQLIHNNFFDLEDTFDLILEQTFFCAINPDLRPEYVLKMHELLNKKGKLVGLLFNIPLNETHPPFGGCKDDYTTQFKPFFKIEILESCYNSIEKRSGNELFFKFIKI
jgi:methyl halide transferase